MNGPSYQRSLPTALVALVVALVVAVWLVACSSDDDAKRAPANSMTSTTATSATTTRAEHAPIAKYRDYMSQNYADDAHWLCRPNRSDICSGDLDSTTVAADGTLTVVPFKAAKDPAIDCFYVYPTISRDPGSLSDWNASDTEEGYAALNQAARLRSQCRVFAPIYRQRTLGVIARRAASGGDSGMTAEEAAQPYADVLDAWRTYLAHDNKGRGVVLIGHSQGSAVLSQLLAEEIDPDADQRSLLVAAYLAGWAVTVPAGADVGGTFQHVPPCRAGEQFGCVVSWASFRSTAPPPANTRFGFDRTGGGPAVCVDPAALAASLEGDLPSPDAMVPAHGEFPASRTASILAAPGDAAPAPWVDGGPTITTPFVSLPGLVTVRCVADARVGYLSVDVHGDPGDPRADDIGGDLTPDWGLHLVDINLVADDIARTIGAQAKAWSAG